MIVGQLSANISKITDFNQHALENIVPKGFLELIEKDTFTAANSTQKGVDWRNKDFFGTNNKITNNLNYLIDMADYRSNPYYRGVSPLGYPPRQRMVIEDPVSGEAQLGMAVYYLDLTKVNVTLTSGPADSMGVQGDLAVMF